jgi:hypothetical protein
MANKTDQHLKVIKGYDDKENLIFVDELESSQDTVPIVRLLR